MADQGRCDGMKDVLNQTGAADFKQLLLLESFIELSKVETAIVDQSILSSGGCRTLAFSTERRHCFGID
ncbi:MAG: hypothetical protein JSS14_28700 [Proteobacteria bacterium]|nr:hypothetical protein [Pseudomonadota bacterium]